MSKVAPVKNSCDPLMIPNRHFEDYAPRYKDLFKLECTDDGILTARWWKDGQYSGEWNPALHRAIGQLCKDVSQDEDVEVMILGGYGNDYIAGCRMPDKEDTENRPWISYENMYYDGCNNEEAIVDDLHIPTIGVLNGTGFHVEMVMFCDITLMADDAQFFDPHFALVNMVPGDGLMIALREMGLKRCTYHVLTGKNITAQEALDWGLVSELVPKDKIYDRAMEIAKDLLKKPRSIRRTTVDLLRRPLKQKIADELRLSFGYEMWQYVGEPEANHDGESIGLDARMKEMGATLEGIETKNK